jgi:hypothetical protein
LVIKGHMRSGSRACTPVRNGDLGEPTPSYNSAGYVRDGGVVPTSSVAVFSRSHASTTQAAS